MMQTLKTVLQFMVMGLLSMVMVGSVAAATTVDGAPSNDMSRVPGAQIGGNCDCTGDLYNCDDFLFIEDAQACLEACGSDIHGIDTDNNGLACEGWPSRDDPAQNPEGDPFAAEDVPAAIYPGEANLVFNGNFEFGFYNVQALGFEARDTGSVPVDWGWFLNRRAYGKYRIYNNEGFGLTCPDDVDNVIVGRNSLSLHMQSTDVSNARLGVYQTINVVRGQPYLFAMRGTIQSQPGSTDPEGNHKVQIAFDHTGGTDWQVFEGSDWISMPWDEYDLEYRVSGPNDPDLAVIEDYYTVVEPRSNNLTIFISGWRRYANYRSVIYTVDCVALVPLSRVNVDVIVPELANVSTTVVDAVLEGGTQASTASRPAAEAQPVDAASAPAPSIIPPSGGVPENHTNLTWIYVSMGVVLIGLIGAGIWNIKRQA